MKSFFQGSLFGFLFSLLAMGVLRFSSQSDTSSHRFLVFTLGGAVMGGLINLLLGVYFDGATD